MAIEFDAAKSQKNKADPSRGFGLEKAAEFEWKTCVTFPDTRHDYGEKRIISIGFIGHRLHVLVWTKRTKKRVRIISLRKANQRMRFYRFGRSRGLVAVAGPVSVGASFTAVTVMVTVAVAVPPCPSLMM